MPLNAHFLDVAPASDRRRYVRRALKLGSDSSADPVTIHDLSLTGALIETGEPMLVGAIFEVELPHAGKVEATVVWNSGEFYGCQFELPISPAALSAAQLQSRPAKEGGSEAPLDAVSELRELNAEIERLSLKMDNALRRLANKD
jgi:hypothetical protein